MFMTVFTKLSPLLPIPDQMNPVHYIKCNFFKFRSDNIPPIYT